MRCRWGRLHAPMAVSTTVSNLLCAKFLRKAMASMSTKNDLFHNALEDKNGFSLQFPRGVQPKWRLSCFSSNHPSRLHRLKPLWLNDPSGIPSYSMLPKICHMSSSKIVVNVAALFSTNCCCYQLLLGIHPLFSLNHHVSRKLSVSLIVGSPMFSIIYP